MSRESLNSCLSLAPSLLLFFSWNNPAGCLQGVWQFPTLAESSEKARSKGLGTCWALLLAACGLGLGKALLNPHLEMEAGAVE